MKLSLLLFEALEVVIRPVMLIALFLGLTLAVDGVANLDIGESKVKVALYQRADTSPECRQFLVEAHELLRETVDLDISRRTQDLPQLTAQMIQDETDIGILCNGKSWQIAVVGRSDLEHQSLVRGAQLAAITLIRHEPWFIKIYRELFGGGDAQNPTPSNWPTAISISNSATSPGSHARIFLPKIIAMLAHFVAFGFACRSVARDVAANTLQTIIATSNGRWAPTILARASVAGALGLAALSFLLALSSFRYGFSIAAPDFTTCASQMLSLTAAVMLGLAASLLVANEIRITMIALSYFVVTFLFSGLISNINTDHIALYSFSKALPANYAMDSLTNFMFHGTSSIVDGNALQNLVAINITALTLLLLVAFRLRRTF